MSSKGPNILRPEQNGRNNIVANNIHNYIFLTDLFKFLFHFSDPNDPSGIETALGYHGLSRNRGHFSLKNSRQALRASYGSLVEVLPL